MEVKPEHPDDPDHPIHAVIAQQMQVAADLKRATFAPITVNGTKYSVAPNDRLELCISALLGDAEALAVLQALRDRNTARVEEAQLTLQSLAATTQLASAKV